MLWLRLERVEDGGWMLDVAGRRGEGMVDGVAKLQMWEWCLSRKGLEYCVSELLGSLRARGEVE